VGDLSKILQEKDKQVEKIIEDKEKKNLEINRLNGKLKLIEAKTEHEELVIEMEEYKRKIMCRCGSEREREVVLMTCPHIFCKKCIEDSVGNRNRKCPICGVKFTKTDVHEICWT
jgi:E3 ubiquitin-protein ligase BRE1